MDAERCKSAPVQDQSLVCQRPIAKLSAYSVNGAGKALKMRSLPPALTSPCMLRAGVKLPDQQLDLQIHLNAAGKEHGRNNLPAQVSLSPQKSTHANPSFLQGAEAASNTSLPRDRNLLF